MRYRPEIDGLRAVSVVPVILFHSGFGLFSGGFVGVDVFFVISGYLITSIILAEKEAGTFSIVNFYERRARRILPALFFVMAVCIPIAWILMDPFELKEFGQSIFATSVFSSNVYFFLKSGYFDTATELKPLLHTWSLAVEEQYYLLYPIFLILVWKFGKSWMITLLVVLALISLCFAQWAALNNPMLAFYLLPARAWELLIGALAAFYLCEKNIKGNQLLSLLGLLMLFYSIFAFNKQTPFPSVYTLLPTVGAVLIILFTTSETIVHRLLSNKAFVGIGLISYSAYLWHQPILAFARVYNLSDLALLSRLTIILATFSLAFFTKRFVEDYFRFKFSALRRSSVLKLSLVMITLFSLLGYSAHKYVGFPDRSALGLLLAQNYGFSENCSGSDILDPKCRSSKDPKVLVWGDSYAMHIVKSLDRLSDKGLVQATLSSCPPIYGYDEAARKAVISCKDYNSYIMKNLTIKAYPHLSTIVLASTFAQLSGNEAREQFAQTIRMILGLGYKVVIISPTPTNKKILKCIKNQDRLNLSDFNKCNYPIEDISPDVQKIFSILDKMTTDLGVSYIDLRKLLCDNGICKVAFNQTLLYRDDGHLSNSSPSFLVERLDNLMPLYD